MAIKKAMHFLKVLEKELDSGEYTPTERKTIRKLGEKMKTRASKTGLAGVGKGSGIFGGH